MTHRTLSVSIVLYKPDLNVLANCLRCLDIACKPINQANATQVWLIDNGHNAEWQQKVNKLYSSLKLPHVDIQYIANPSNPGYGGGNNIAIKQSNTDYHLVLNPDVFMEPDCLFESISYLKQHPNCVHLAPSTVGDDGERHNLCRKNISLYTQFLRSVAPSFLKRLHKQRLLDDEYQQLDYNQPMHNVEFLSGCFMLLKTAAAKKIGGFDEKYFMYVEDADLTRRLLEIGDNIYLPKARIVHLWARFSSRKLKYLLHHVHSSIHYCWKFR